MNIQAESPSHRHKDSGLDAALGVHDQLAGSSLPNHALNEPEPLPEIPIWT